jgi:hypothetical protein
MHVSVEFLLLLLGFLQLMTMLAYMLALQ